MSWHRGLGVDHELHHSEVFVLHLPCLDQLLHLRLVLTVVVVYSKLGCAVGQLLGSHVTVQTFVTLATQVSLGGFVVKLLLLGSFVLIDDLVADLIASVLDPASLHEVRAMVDSLKTIGHFMASRVLSLLTDVLVRLLELSNHRMALAKSIDKDFHASFK